MKSFTVGPYTIGKNCPFTIICGPCVIESLDLALSSASFLKELCAKLHINLIYKSSYDKANRSSLSSYRGPGMDEGLNILSRVKSEFNIPVFTDIHDETQAQPAADVCDMIQIPAFLCRQTSLLVAAAITNIPINIKKGQFVAPWDMVNVVNKIKESGNDQILLTDRGSMFGYNNMVSDFRAIPIMQELGFPVCFDATHSVQLPGGLGDRSGGQREFIPVLARAAIAAGANVLYIEAHPDPKNAKCDASSMISFDDLEEFLVQTKSLYQLMQTFHI